MWSVWASTIIDKHIHTRKHKRLKPVRCWTVVHCLLLNSPSSASPSRIDPSHVCWCQKSLGPGGPGCEKMLGIPWFRIAVHRRSIHLWSTKSWQWLSRLELPQGHVGTIQQLCCFYSSRDQHILVGAVWPTVDDLHYIHFKRCKIGARCLVYHSIFTVCFARKNLYMIYIYTYDTYIYIYTHIFIRCMGVTKTYCTWGWTSIYQLFWYSAGRLTNSHLSLSLSISMSMSISISISVSVSISISSSISIHIYTYIYIYIYLYLYLHQHLHLHL